MPPDPDKGKPHRHTRQKAQLLMNSWGEGELTWLRLRLAMNYLLDKRPEDVLDAIIYATGED